MQMNVLMAVMLLSGFVVVSVVSDEGKTKGKDYWLRSAEKINDMGAEVAIGKVSLCTVSKSLICVNQSWANSIHELN